MSRQDDLQKLITNYNRRLQKLQEQQALMGLDTPPHILIEIEDIEAKITELETKLTELAAAEISTAPGRSSGQSVVKTVRPAPPARPQRRDTDGQTIFVGRQPQLAELEHYWQEAFQQRQGKVVFLTGEAGIGKTSLVRQFSQKVLDTSPGIQYASAQCDQIAGDISPYAPFIQLLNNLTEQAVQRGNHWAVDFAREIGPDILQMVPVAGPLLAMAAKSVDFAWRRRPWSTVSEMDEPRGHFGQQDIFQQFTDTFCNLARKQNPLLLFIDDWHWADASSTNLLFHLARHLRDVPILLLATYRPHDAQARQHPILTIRTEMERYQLCAGLSLEFFSRDDLTTYLARRFPQAKFEPVFVDWLLDITNGNALFVTEYVNLLGKEKLLTSNGQLVGDMEQIIPPANVEAVIRSRIGYLDREARDMLAYGSVEGEQFTTLVLSRLLDIKPLLLLKRLRAIEEIHQLIASLGQQTVYEHLTTIYRFVHTLVHHTLYNTLETEERVEINRSLLELYSEIYEQADETVKANLLPALMTCATETRDYIAVATYALAASRVARVNYATTEALRNCQVGLEAIDKITGRSDAVNNLQMDLLMSKASAEDFIGAWSEAEKSCEQAAALADSSRNTRRLAQVLSKQAWILRNLGNMDKALAVSNEALSMAEKSNDQDTLATVYLLVGTIKKLDRNYDEALVTHKKALEIWEGLGNQLKVAIMCNWIGMLYSNQRKYAIAIEYYDKAKRICKQIGNKSELVWTYIGLGKIYFWQNSYAEALEVYRMSLEISVEIGLKRGEAEATHYIGTVFQTQGDYINALTYYHKALIIHENMKHKHYVDEARRRIAEVEAKLAAQNEPQT